MEEKIKEYAAFQLWLHIKYKDFPKDTAELERRAKEYLSDTKPIFKNEKCTLGKIWTECNEPCDQCCECDHYKP